MLAPYQYDVYVDGVQTYRVIEADAVGGWYVQLNAENVGETKYGKVEIRSYSKQGEFLGLVDHASAHG